ncbi:kinase-like protein [Xylariaceae sp. FL1651]|nr:kinase-like protein [Xylariaceae sp. FL1651]
MNQGSRRGIAREESDSTQRAAKSRLNEVTQELQNAVQRRNEPSHRFIHYSDLQKIWRKAGIACVFQQVDQQQYKDVQSRALRLISFLVYLRMAPDWYFRFDGFSGQPGRPGIDKWNDYRMPLEPLELRALGVPEQNIFDWQDQYCFIPSVIRFNPREHIQKISDPNIRLPLIHCGESAHGGYGDVTLYSIAPEHVVDEDPHRHHWHPTQPHIVAVKEFHTQKDGINEARNMRLLKESLDKNGNISLHEAIIEQGAEDNLKVFIIFPRAPFGDLWQFLHGGKPIDDTMRPYNFASRFPKAVDDDIDPAPALLKQCRDLTGALKFLHEGFPVGRASLFCAHMDLKPNNIIIFDGAREEDVVGTWKLCDFGISAFKESQEIEASEVVSVGDYHAQITMNTKARRDPGPYQAPEVWQVQETVDISPQAALQRGKVGRKSDIWSFGAIFAEVLTFALDRERGVEEFACRRRVRQHGTGYDTDYFYMRQTIVTDTLMVPGQSQAFTIQVTPQVFTWLDKLCADSSTPQRWANCWAECIRQILQVDPDKRPSARRLKKWVNHVYDHTFNSTQIEDINCMFLDSAPHPPLNPHRQPSSLPSPPPSRRSSSLPDNEDNDQDDDDLEHPTEAQSPGFMQINPHTLRTVGQPQIRELELGRSKAVAVATDGVNIAFLKKSSIILFKVQNQDEGSNPITIPEHISWKGVAIAGEYLAVWGLTKSPKESRLRVMKLGDNPQWLDLTGRNYDSTRKFDYDKRVALSAQGYIAFILSENIYVIDLSSVVLDPTFQSCILNNLRRNRRPRPYKLPVPADTATRERIMPAFDREFVDLAFDNMGKLLYAWANIGSDGALCIYRSGNLAQETPEYRGYYRYNTNEYRHATRLIPYTNSFGCLVASANVLYFPSVIRGSMAEQKRPLPRHISRQLQDANVKTACMFNNSLITIQKPLPGTLPPKWHSRLFFYPLNLSGSPRIQHGTELTKVKETPTDASVICVKKTEDDYHIYVIHVDGKVEVIQVIPEN